MPATYKEEFIFSLYAAGMLLFQLLCVSIFTCINAAPGYFHFCAAANHRFSIRFRTIINVIICATAVSTQLMG